MENLTVKNGTKTGQRKRKETEMPRDLDNLEKVRYGVYCDNQVQD